MLWLVFHGYGDHRYLNVLTHSFPARRASDLLGELLAGTSFARYLDPNTLARMGVGGSSLSGDSAATRMDLVWFSLHEAARSPLFGHGSGYEIGRAHV